MKKIALKGVQWKQWEKIRIKKIDINLVLKTKRYQSSCKKIVKFKVRLKDYTKFEKTTIICSSLTYSSCTQFFVNECFKITFCHRGQQTKY